MTSPSSMHKTGHSKLGRWDNPERWGGEGGGGSSFTFKLINQFFKKESASVSRFSPVWLFATLWTVARQAPPSMGFSGQEYWSGVPFPSLGDLPHPGPEPMSPILQTDIVCVFKKIEIPLLSLSQYHFPPQWVNYCSQSDTCLSGHYVCVCVCVCVCVYTYIYRHTLETHRFCSRPPR